MRSCLVIGTILLATACGRIDFDELGVPVDTPGLMPPLACARPRLSTHRLTSSGSAGAFSIATTDLGLGIEYLDTMTRQLVVIEVDERGNGVREPATLPTAPEILAGIAWSGSELWVVHALPSPPSTFEPRTIMLSRVDRAGHAEDSALTTGGEAYTYGLALSAHDGIGMAVWVADIFATQTAESGLWVAPVGADGQRAGLGYPTSVGTDCLCSPKVAPAGAGWALFYNPNSSPQLRLLAADGAPITAGVPTAATLPGASHLASTGITTVVAYAGMSDNQIHAARFDAGGQPIDDVVRSATVRFGASNIAAFGSTLLVAYGDADMISLWSLGPDAISPGDPVALIPATPDFLALAPLGDGIGIVWPANGDLYLGSLVCP